MAAWRWVRHDRLIPPRFGFNHGESPALGVGACGGADARLGKKRKAGTPRLAKIGGDVQATVRRVDALDIASRVPSMAVSRVVAAVDRTSTKP